VGSYHHDMTQSKTVTGEQNLIAFRLAMKALERDIWGSHRGVDGYVSSGVWLTTPCPKTIEDNYFSSLARRKLFIYRRRGKLIKIIRKWSAPRRGRWLHNKHRRRIFEPSVGFKAAIPAIERPHTYTLDRTASGNSTEIIY